MISTKGLAIVLPLIFLAAAANAQETETTVTGDERERAVAVAEQIELLMTDLETRAANFPAVLDQLRKGEIAIEQADQTVADLIAQFTAVTAAMEDGSEFDNFIDIYKTRTEELIAVAEASDNESIRGSVDTLRLALTQLNTDDETRAQTVVDARNVIAALEDDREAIAFAIQAQQVLLAAEAVSGSIEEYADIVARGRAVADSLIDAANP